MITPISSNHLLRGTEFNACIANQHVDFSELLDRAGSADVRITA
jgi:hypothetical protein